MNTCAIATKDVRPYSKSSFTKSGARSTAMRSLLFLLLLTSTLFTSFTQAQLQWSKHNFGTLDRIDRADFNGDGFPDVFVYEERFGISVFINSGSGTSSGGSFLEQQVGRADFLDFNRDNKIDVVGCDISANLVI